MFEEDSHVFSDQFMIALIKQELDQSFMGEDNEEVFFSLEDDVPVASSKPTKAAPVAEEKETILEDVEVLDAEIVMQATGDYACLLYTSPSPRDGLLSRMPSSA